MSELTIRPTTKFLKAWAVLVLLVVLVAWIAHFAGEIPQIWIPAVVSISLVSPLMHWVKLRTTVTVLTADRLRSETGLFGKSTHSLVLSRIQDVGVNQSLFQRMCNVGDVWIETAGAASRIMVENIDAPHSVVERILAGAKQGF